MGKYIFYEKTKQIYSVQKKQESSFPQMSVLQHGSWIPAKVCLEPSYAQLEISLQACP